MSIDKYVVCFTCNKSFSEGEVYECKNCTELVCDECVCDGIICDGCFSDNPGSFQGETYIDLYVEIPGR